MCALSHTDRCLCAHTHGYRQTRRHRYAHSQAQIYIHTLGQAWVCKCREVRQTPAHTVACSVHTLVHSCDITRTHMLRHVGSPVAGQGAPTRIPCVLDMEREEQWASVRSPFCPVSRGTSELSCISSSIPPFYGVQPGGQRSSYQSQGEVGSGKT